MNEEGHGYAIPLIQGDQAHDGVDRGFPVKIGGKASTSLPAAVANGDRVNAYFDANGRLHVVLNVGTGPTDLGKAEDSPHVSGDTGTMALAVRQDAATALAANGDYHPLEVDANGRLHVIELNSTAIGTLLTTLAGIVTSARAAVNPIVGQTGVQGGTGASTALTQRVDLATDGNTVQGTVAHDGADAGNPVKIGGKAVAWAATPTAVAAADRTDQLYTLDGRPFTQPGHPNQQCKEFTVTDADGAQTNLALITPTSGKRLVITGCTVRPDNADTGDVDYRIGLVATPFSLAARSLTGVANVFASSAGDAAGSGINGPPNGASQCTGAVNDKCVLTCEDPVGGKLIIILWWHETD